jgi:hypothetical protein
VPASASMRQRAIAPSGDGGRCSDSSNPAVADSERTAPDLRAVAVRG